MRRHFLADADDSQHYGMSGAKEFSHFAVAQLQSTLARNPEDPATLELVHDLRSNSAEFERLWSGPQVATAAHGVKHLHHPQLGTLTLTCDVLLVPDADQHVVLLSAPAGTPSADRLAEHIARSWAASALHPV